MEPSAQSPEELLDVAMAHHRAGRLAEALTLYQHVLAAQPADAEVLFLAGSAAHGLGFVDRAVSLLETAISIRPDFAAALNNLGMVLRATGRDAEAEARYHDAIAADAGFAAAWRNLGDALKARGAFVEAAEACRRAVAIDPDDAEGHNNLGMALRASGESSAAEAALRRALALRPAYAVARYNLCTLLLETGRASGVAALCADGWLGGAMAGGLLACRAIAAGECGDGGTRDRLMDLDGLVQTVLLPPPSGYADRAAYDRDLARHVSRHPTLRYQPDDQSTRFGSVTRDLLIAEKGPVAVLEAEVTAALAVYMASLTRRYGAAGHPMLAICPARTRLTAWGVVMERSGHQAPHIHPAGWLSAVYYARLPAAVAASAGAGSQGCIEFGRPPDAFRCHDRHPVRLIRPQEGMLVVFPSYFFHRTIPYEADEARISVAFDLGPAA